MNGFSGNCFSQKLLKKIGTIGGLLVETIFARDLFSLKNALLEIRPLTIVLMNSIHNCNDKFYDLRIEDFKTIIDSYIGNRLTDARLRTDGLF